MKTPAILFASVIFLYSASALADNEGNSKRNNSTSNEIESFKNEALRKRSQDIFNTIESEALYSSGNSMLSNGGPNYNKIAGYALALEEKSEAKDPEAAFYFAIYNGKICRALQKMDKGQPSEGTRKCWSKSLENFKIASKANSPAASYNIAKMYEEGYGVLASKLAAAEWYTKAANQFMKSNSREDALASIEAALNAQPDFPSALRLRKILLNY